MQLGSPKKRPALREALSTAAAALLLVPAAAKAQSDPTNKIDVTNLLYGEQGRTQVVEPIVKFTHLFSDTNSISAQLGIDVITGASPSGALPSGTVQTRTSASGRTITSSAGAIPTAPFHDRRIAFDPEWQKGWGRFVTTDIGAHFSREKDYQSLGVNGKMSTDVLHRLVTLTIGGGVNKDSVFPIGGITAGLADSSSIGRSRPKNVSNVLLGASRVISRNWLVAVNGTHTMENGYLTEPYKIISVLNAAGTPIGDLTEKRPSTRNRSSLLFSSVYHFTDDVLYTSYRYYWDTWGIRSHTLDLKYRHDFDETMFLEPLFRVYSQSAASFYTGGLMSGAPLPDFASSDYRLGKLQTITLGATFGFRFEDAPGDWIVRGQYMRQFGDSSPPNAIGIQRGFDLAPPLNIFAVVVGYSFGY